MTVSQTYHGTPGLNFIYAPELLNTKIYCVMREGIGFSVVDADGPLGPRQCNYLSGYGKIVFIDNFIGPPPDVPISVDSLEDVFVLYKQ